MKPPPSKLVFEYLQKSPKKIVFSFKGRKSTRVNNRGDKKCSSQAAEISCPVFFLKYEKIPVFLVLWISVW